MQFFIDSFAFPEMEFFGLTLENRYFFANSLRPSSFYKSEAEIGTDKLESVIEIWDWVFLRVSFIKNQTKCAVPKIS